MTDPISDLITRIRNGYMSRKKVVSAPASKAKEAILRVLTQEGYIDSYKKKETQFEIFLKYLSDRPSISGIKRVSKPGVRIYRRKKKVPRTLSSFGVTIISTSKGVMTDREARKQNIGGEIICQVW